jgi:hypothetical protein
MYSKLSQQYAMSAVNLKKNEISDVQIFLENAHNWVGTGPKDKQI